MFLLKINNQPYYGVATFPSSSVCCFKTAIRVFWIGLISLSQTPPQWAPTGGLNVRFHSFSQSCVLDFLTISFFQCVLEFLLCSYQIGSTVFPDPHHCSSTAHQSANGIYARVCGRGVCHLQADSSAHKMGKDYSPSLSLSSTFLNSYRCKTVKTVSYPPLSLCSINVLQLPCLFCQRDLLDPQFCA